MNVTLASASPRRKELLRLFHIPFSVSVADVDEQMDDTLPVAEEVARVSRLKACAVPHEPDDLVIAADTVVVCNGKLLGKPKDEADARRMLTLLSGRDHQVMTGMTVLRGDQCITCTEIADVHFRDLANSEIEAYIRTGEPMDKAGSYGIQGGAALFVERINGDYYTIMGLPVCRLATILRQLAPEITEEHQ